MKGLSECGSYLPKREVSLVKFHSLNDDVTADVASFKIGITQPYIGSNNILLEKGLIANRAKIQEACCKADSDICPKHRYSLGKYYRPPRSCIYPNHPQLNKSCSKKKAPLQTASIKFLERIERDFPRHASVGDGLCTTCRNTLEKMDAEDVQKGVEEIEDPSFSESVSSLPDVNETIQSFTDSVSPVKFQLRSSVDDITDHTAKKLKRKLTQCVNAAAEYFCEMLAPGQASEIKKRFLGETLASAQEKSIPAEIENLLEPFKQAPSQQARLVTLTLVPDHITKKEVMQYFKCSRYLVDKVRLIRKVNGAGCPESLKKPIHRDRLDMAEAEHFIDFLISNGYFQDVATGTTTTDISNGSAVVIPHIVSTSLKYHLVKIYEDHCKAFDYKPLSTSSLLRVLDQCKFSQRRQITGLDNYPGDGIEGFRILECVLDKIGLNNEEKKHLKHSLSLAVAYLKGLFRSHVSTEESKCPSHCRKFALTNPADKDLVSECDHQHDKSAMTVRTYSNA